MRKNSDTAVSVEPALGPDRPPKSERHQLLKQEHQQFHHQRQQQYDSKNQHNVKNSQKQET